MTAATGWRALYAPKTGTDSYDLAWTTKVPVIVWGDAAVGSSDTTDGVAVVGWIIDSDGDPAAPTATRGVLRPAHLANFTGTDGREQVFVMYLPPGV